MLDSTCVASVHCDVILGFTNIYSLSLSAAVIYINSVTCLPSSFSFLIHRANAVFNHTPLQGHVIAWQQLLPIRLAPQQILQIALVNSAIGLRVAAQFGSRVTCSCHVTVALKDLLAIPHRWPNVRVRTLVLHGGEKQ